MSCTLTAVLLLDSAGHSDGPQDTVGSDPAPDICMTLKDVGKVDMDGLPQKYA